MTIHIGAQPGEIAETVLLPGDPLRAKWAAETFLDDAKCVNQVRGMLGFTGFWRGNPVTIQGSGMGMPSLSIYVNELIKDYDAKTLIRIGSAGGMSSKVKLRDVVIAMTASTLSTPSLGMFKEINFAPCADYGLLEAAVASARGRGRERDGRGRPRAAARRAGAREHGRVAARGRRPGAVPERPGRRRPQEAARDARPRLRAELEAGRRGRRPGDPGAHRAVRDGLPYAGECAGDHRFF